MGFSTNELFRLRPFAYHTSCLENFRAIQRHLELRSATEILEGTRHAQLLGRRRTRSVALEIAGERIVIRDNKPLRPGSLLLTHGWQLHDWLRELNSRVYFWPGTAQGPIRPGRAHCERYAGESPVFVIRMPTRSLVNSNKTRQLWVARCNSGSARHHSGRPVQRGPDTFQRPATAGFRPSKIVEFTYKHRATLPVDATWSESLDGPWLPLSSAG